LGVFARPELVCVAKTRRQCKHLYQPVVISRPMSTNVFMSSATLYKLTPEYTWERA